MDRRVVWVGLVSLGSFAGGIVADALFPCRSSVVAQPSAALPPPPADAPERAAAPYTEAFEEVIRRVAPTVVAVDAFKAGQPGSPRAKSKPTEESGSGVVIRLDGFPGRYAITNNHVVGGAAANDITVTLADTRILRPQRVWADPESDVALLKLPDDSVPAADLADSDRVRLGQWVLAFGSPFGLHQSVTHGIVSARDRGQISLGDTIRIKEFLQTDAAINPGSSGGPLVDLNGAVVGINTAIASNNGNNSGVSFSIPANLVRRVSRELLEKGRVARGYTGMQLAPAVEPAAALRLGLDRVVGTLVEGVHPGGPADRGGVRPGDVILKLDAVTIRNENHLINLIGSLPIGQRVRLTLWRDRQALTADVVIQDWAETVGRTR